MDHKLHVTVRVDIDQPTVCLEVRGCLTAASSIALFPLIRRAHNLLNGTIVTVDVSAAAHIEAAGIASLHRFAAREPGSGPHTSGEATDGRLTIIAPAELPKCAASEVLDADRRLVMA